MYKYVHVSRHAQRSFGDLLQVRFRLLALSCPRPQTSNYTRSVRPLNFLEFPQHCFSSILYIYLVKYVLRYFLLRITLPTYQTLLGQAPPPAQRVGQYDSQKGHFRHVLPERISSRVMDPLQHRHDIHHPKNIFQDKEKRYQRFMRR